MHRFGPATLATVLGLLGCAPSIVPRAEFLRRGNAICAATAARVAELAMPHAGARARPEALPGYVDAYVAELRQEVAGLRLIGFPAGERRTLKRAYDAADAALWAVDRDPSGFRRALLAPSAAELRGAGLGACRA